MNRSYGTIDGEPILVRLTVITAHLNEAAPANDIDVNRVKFASSTGPSGELITGRNAWIPKFVVLLAPGRDCLYTTYRLGTFLYILELQRARPIITSSFVFGRIQAYIYEKYK